MRVSLLALEGVFDLGLADATYLFYEGQREREGSFTAADEQRLRNDQRQGNFQREPGADSLLGLNLDFAIERLQISAAASAPRRNTPAAAGTRQRRDGNRSQGCGRHGEQSSGCAAGG